MIAGRRLFLAGIFAGALLRGLVLPLPGTTDVVIWKVWSFAATEDVAGMYGVGGTPPERRIHRWHGEQMTVDYPPVSLYELAIVGRVYRAIRPLYQDSAWLTVAVKTPGLIAEIVLLVIVYRIALRDHSEEAARWGSLALWLNPALILDGPILGYLDLQMAVPLVFAVFWAWRGHAAYAGVLLAVAVLTKPQAVFVAPSVVALLAWRPAGRPRRRAVATVALASSVTAAVLVLPFLARGAWSNMVQALGRLASHDMLSAHGANIWWIFTWILRVQSVWAEWGPWAALSQPVRILGIQRAAELGYPNARVVGLVMVGAALAWACYRARQIQSLAAAWALAAWSIYAYAMLAAQVHENHLIPTVMLLAPAAALDRQYRTLFWLVTAVAALNLYLFGGLWWGYQPVINRSITGIDASLLLSVLSVVTFGMFTRGLVSGSRR